VKVPLLTRPEGLARRPKGERQTKVTVLGRAKQHGRLRKAKESKINC